MNARSSYTLRPAEASDVEAVLRVHHDAVRVLCAADYPPEEIAAWIAQADDPVWLLDAIARPEHVVLVAELYGSVAGFAERCGDAISAVYVHPLHARRGVASMLVEELERSAVTAGICYLSVEASVTAEPFYRSAGFEVLSRGRFRFRDGTTIASVRMIKRLQSSAAARE